MKAQGQQIDHKDQRSLSQAIEIDPYDHNKYMWRSTCYEHNGETHSAIIDLSKSLLLYPNLEGYFRRGKLYASSSMFVYALMDFEEADKIYREEMVEQSPISDIECEPPSEEAITFLSKSLVVQKLPEIKSLAKKQQKQSPNLPPELNEQFALLLNQLIDQKIANNTQQQQEKYQKLLEVVREQDRRIQELQNSLQNKTMDYQQIFYKEMEGSTLSQTNKDKCMVYFHSVLSELEEYYLAAKVLNDIDQKKLKFGDYQVQEPTKGKFSYGITKALIEKMFKAIEKNHSKLQRAGEIVKDIPYIGTAFKLVKSAVKGFSWFEDIKVESECENILALRPNVTSFNVFAAHLGYEMYHHFKLNITTQSPNVDQSTVYKRTNWEKVAKGYKNFRKRHVGPRLFKHLSQVQNDYLHEMGQVHASIFMVGVAYGFFKMPHGTMFPSEEDLTLIFNRLSEIENKLLVTVEEEQPLIQITETTKQGVSDGVGDKLKVCSLF